MSEISSLDIEIYDYVSDYYKESYKQVGKAILWGSSIIAMGSVIPSFAKKNRTYTPIIVAPQGGMQVAEAPAIDEGLEALRCTQEARDKIVRLWTQLADGYLTPDLWQLGNEIENDHQVHPFAMFIVIPRDKFRRIFTSNDYFYTLARIPTIMWGIGKGMRKAQSVERPVSWPNLWALLPSFAAQMNKEEAQIRRLIQAADWRGLVHYLYDI